MLLAIDTATRLLSLALHDGVTLIAEQTWRTNNRHNTLLAPAIQQMLDVCDVPADDLTAIAVTNGPGSYTGLRIGVAMAKGLAGMRQLPLIGISTLEMLAAGQPYQTTGYALIGVIQAGRGRIIAQEFRAKKGRWEATTDPIRDKWETILEGLEGSYYITGEIDDTGREAIAEANQRDDLSLTEMSAAYQLRRAGFLAQEAWRRYHAADDLAADFAPALLVPLYMSEPG